MGEKLNDTKVLLEKELISLEQFDNIKAYRSLGIFSLHNELLFLLYLSVLMFTSGVGILIYKNIDGIGHAIILTFLFILTVVCFYFCFKKSKGFSKRETEFENPVYDYLVLLATLLSCTFVGYLQFQYNVFGSPDMATFVCALSGLFSAYYFDNKSALSIGITALATAIGISLTPKSLLLGDDYFTDSTLTYSGLALGILLIFWLTCSSQLKMKKHFELVFLTFSLNLISVCCIASLFKNFWFIFLILLCGSTYYFYRKSHEIKSTFIFVFTLLYAYIGLNILLYKAWPKINSDILFWSTLVFIPFYIVASILVFIKLIVQFNKKTNDTI